jgi:hypothetical protein
MRWIALLLITTSGLAVAACSDWELSKPLVWSYPDYVPDL